jgi:hypothetical protein
MVAKLLAEVVADKAKAGEVGLLVKEKSVAICKVVNHLALWMHRSVDLPGGQRWCGKGLPSCSHLSLHLYFGFVDCLCSAVGHVEMNWLFVGMSGFRQANPSSSYTGVAIVFSVLVVFVLCR